VFERVGPFVGFLGGLLEEAALLEQAARDSAPTRHVLADCTANGQAANCSRPLPRRAALPR
jgi:hypothetical protein